MTEAKDLREARYRVTMPDNGDLLAGNQNPHLARK